MNKRSAFQFYLYAVVASSLMCTTVFLSKIFTIPVFSANDTQIHMFLFVLFYMIFGINVYDFYRISFIAFFFVVLTVLQILMGAPNMPNERSVAAMIALILTYPVTIRILYWSYVDNYSTFFIMLRFFIFVQLVLQVFQIFNSEISYELFFDGELSYEHYFLPIVRPPGLFPEPSHMALNLSPMIFLLIVHFKFSKDVLGYTGILSLISSFFICLSATFIGICIGAFILRLFKKDISAIKASLYVAISSAFFATFIIYTPKLEKRFLGVIVNIINADFDANLASVIAFFRGLEMGFIGFTEYIFGVGVMNNTALSPKSSFPVTLADGTILPRFGGTLFGQGLGEMGLFFVIFTVLAIYIIIKRVREYKYSTNYIVESMFIFCIFASFLRGTGYFDSGVIIGINIVIEFIFIKSMRVTAHRGDMD